MLSTKTLLKYLPNIVVVPPILLILYALPYSFSIPTTRISIPFANNTAEATSIVLVSSFFITTFFCLRSSPPFWRIMTTFALSEIGFVFFEVIHILNMHTFRIGYTLINDFSFLFKNAMITVGILGILWVINTQVKTTHVTGITCLCFISFIVMTIIQISRDWYNTGSDDPYTVLYKGVGIWMWLTLVRRSDK